MDRRRSARPQVDGGVRGARPRRAQPQLPLARLRIARLPGRDADRRRARARRSARSRSLPRARVRALRRAVPAQGDPARGAARPVGQRLPQPRSGGLLAGRDAHLDPLALRGAAQADRRGPAARSRCRCSTTATGTTTTSPPTASAARSPPASSACTSVRWEQGHRKIMRIPYRRMDLPPRLGEARPQRARLTGWGTWGRPRIAIPSTSAIASSIIWCSWAARASVSASATKDEMRARARDFGIDLVGFCRLADLEAEAPDYDKPSKLSSYLQDSDRPRAPLPDRRRAVSRRRAAPVRHRSHRAPSRGGGGAARLLARGARRDRGAAVGDHPRPAPPAARLLGARRPGLAAAAPGGGRVGPGLAGLEPDAAHAAVRSTPLPRGRRDRSRRFTRRAVRRRALPRASKSAAAAPRSVPSSRSRSKRRPARRSAPCARSIMRRASVALSPTAPGAWSITSKRSSPLHRPTPRRPSRAPRDTEKLWFNMTVMRQGAFTGCARCELVCPVGEDWPAVAASPARQLDLPREPRRTRDGDLVRIESLRRAAVG